MANLNLSLKRYLDSTPIPNMFIDQYMTSANHSYVVIYIFGYRHCLSQMSSITTMDMAKALNMLESDVVNAWKYWQGIGLVEIDENGDNFSIEFLPLPPSAPKPLELKAASSNIKALVNIEPFKETERENNEPVNAPAPLVVLESRPQYTLEELEIYKRQSKDIANVFAKAESMLGKLLSYNDLNVLFGLYDWLRLPVDVILNLIEYCGENDHRNIRYLEKVAVNWAENGINTVEKAEEYIKTYNRDYREILKAFGLNNRNPSTSEINYMNKWLGEYGLPMEIVLEACDRTIMNTGKPQFSYANKVIKAWSDAGIKTLDEIKRLDESFYMEKGKAAKTQEEKAKAPAAKKNRFANFKQRDNNYEELEKMEREYLQQNLKG